VALRASTAGLAVAGVAGLLALISVGSGLLPPALRIHTALGWGAAAVTGAAGTWVQSLLSSVPPGHPLLAQRYAVGLAANFFLQAAAVTIGCLALAASGVKFAGTAAFALAFAVTATAQHTAGVVVLSRSLRGAAASPER
jgi:hypothetical protein